MGTQITELARLNKSRAKRDLSAATFTMTMELPGGNSLGDGTHLVGKIEGNVAITRVVLLIRDGFNGTAPTVALDDNDGVAYFGATTLVVNNVIESAITANTATRPAPIYKENETTFTATMVTGTSTKGDLAFVIDYVQLDTVVGKHTV